MKRIILTFLISVTAFTQIKAEEHGIASIYSTICNGGTKTASGVKLQNNTNMVAHKTLPFGTKVKITNKKTGKVAEGVVVDRGPYIKGRIIDVTHGVASKLGLTKKQGITSVKVEVIGKVKIK